VGGSTAHREGVGRRKQNTSYFQQTKENKTVTKTSGLLQSIQSTYSGALHGGENAPNNPRGGVPKKGVTILPLLFVREVRKKGEGGIRRLKQKKREGKRERPTSGSSRHRPKSQVPPHRKGKEGGGISGGKRGEERGQEIQEMAGLGLRERE